MTIKLRYYRKLFHLYLLLKNDRLAGAVKFFGSERLPPEERRLRIT